MGGLLRGYMHNQEELTAFIEEHLQMHHLCGPTLLAPEPFTVLTESYFSPMAKEKKGILNALSEAIRVGKERKDGKSNHITNRPPTSSTSPFHLLSLKD